MVGHRRIPGVESCVCVSLVLFMINIICDVSADKLTASDECHVVNNSYCYSTFACVS